MTELASFDDPKLEALIEAMYLAASADGEFSDDERKHFVASVESLTDRRLSGERLDQLVDTIAKAVESAGRASRLASVKVRLTDARMRKVALSMAIRMMAVDGIIRTSERELILEMA